MEHTHLLVPLALFFVAVAMFGTAGSLEQAQPKNWRDVSLVVKHDIRFIAVFVLFTAAFSLAGI